MAAGAVAGRVRRWSAGVPLMAALAATLAPAQVRITLWQLETRSGPDYAATYQGQRVIVRGVVAAPAFRLPDYNLQAIQDGRNGGMLQLPVSGAMGGPHPAAEPPGA